MPALVNRVDMPFDKFTEIIIEILIKTLKDHRAFSDYNYDYVFEIIQDMLQKSFAIYEQESMLMEPIDHIHHTIVEQTIMPFHNEFPIRADDMRGIVKAVGAMIAKFDVTYVWFLTMPAFEIIDACEDGFTVDFNRSKRF